MLVEDICELPAQTAECNNDKQHGLRFFYSQDDFTFIFESI